MPQIYNLTIRNLILLNALTKAKFKIKATARILNIKQEYVSTRLLPLKKLKHPNLFTYHTTNREKFYKQHRGKTTVYLTSRLIPKPKTTNRISGLTKQGKQLLFSSQQLLQFVHDNGH